MAGNPTATRTLFWLDEQSLIWRAQHHGDRAAVDRLLQDNDSMVCAWSKRVAAFTGARKVEADMAQEGRMVLYERIHGYEFGRSPTWWVWARYLAYALEEERVLALLAAAAEFTAPEDPAAYQAAIDEHVRGLRLAGLLEVQEEWVPRAQDWRLGFRAKKLPALTMLETSVRTGVGSRATRLRPARLFSYAFRKVLSAMTACGCDALEIVRLPRSSKIHAAHRLIDAGADAGEVAEELGIDPEVAASLNRTTLPEQDGDPDPHREAPGAVLERREASLAALGGMGAEARAVVLLMASLPDGEARARVLGLAPYDLWLTERDAEKEFQEAVRVG